MGRIERASESINPNHVGRIRVLVVGDSGCGKTSFMHYLTTGKKLTRSSATVGCNVFVKLFEYQETKEDSPTPFKRQYFIELWDVGSHPRYQHLRKLFYDQVNGVILMHDLSSPKSHSSLIKWATELAGESSFIAPYPTQIADGNIGGLPVPVLVLGGKSDLSVSPATVQKSLCRWLSWWPLSWICPKAYGTLPRDTLDKKTIAVSSLSGVVNTEALNSFFSELIERRYYAGRATYGIEAKKQSFAHCPPPKHQTDDTDLDRIDAQKFYSLV